MQIPADGLSDDAQMFDSADEVVQAAMQLETHQVAEVDALKISQVHVGIGSKTDQHAKTKYISGMQCRL